jgi:hypothetical protein
MHLPIDDGERRNGVVLCYTIVDSVVSIALLDFSFLCLEGE